MTADHVPSFNPLVAELARLPDRLTVLLDGLSDERLRRRPADDAWSIIEIACHLRDAARIDHERLFLMLTHERPLLRAYDQEALARAKRYRQAEPASVLAELRVWREETVALLAGLAPAAWERIGVHEEHGEESLVQRAAHMVDHESVHLRDITRLRGD